MNSPNPHMSHACLWRVLSAVLLLSGMSGHGVVGLLLRGSVSEPTYQE
jgi:hypothetical protein